ncbi:MAG: hypothetical protein IPI97_10595 [Nitrosomonas sp.]|jgi:septal ring factor EnvC (AmiA/AmiB activator)|nr:hypothetical protein [Nitrosomonas sp.]
MKRILLLGMLFIPLITIAEDLSLRQRANYAFEQMKEAERDLTTITQTIEVKADRLEYFKQKVIETEQELANAYKESQEINKRVASTRNRWEQLSNQLLQGGAVTRD